MKISKLLQATTITVATIAMMITIVGIFNRLQLHVKQYLPAKAALKTDGVLYLLNTEAMLDTKNKQIVLTAAIAMVMMLSITKTKIVIIIITTTEAIP